MTTASLTRKSLALRALCAAGLAAGIFASAAAVQGQSRTRVEPYLQIQQVLNADLNGGDVLTYTGVGGGVEVSIEGRQVRASVSYDYQRRIAWEDDLADDDVHSGLAAVQVAVVPNMLTFDAAAMATRSHSDIDAPVPGYRTADDPNLVDVYAVFGGPSLSTRAGPATITASYRLGYVHVDDHGLSNEFGEPDQPRFDSYNSSTVQSASASIGMAPGELPFGWTVAAGWSREDAERLDATNDAKFVRGDIVVPVSPTIALTGGVGYEDIGSSLQDFRRDAGGLPLLTANGELIPDPSRARLRPYDQEGFIWDVGAIWRPSSRTELQGRFGHRYGGTTYLGSLRHRINRTYGLTASVYDSVSSFGQLLTLNLNNVPVSFNAGRNGVNGGLGGIGNCVAGTDPGSGTCFDDAFQSINGSTFRVRGADAQLSGERGRWSFSGGAGYVSRRYFAPPATANIFSRDRVTDESFTIQGNLGRRLTSNSGINANAYTGWYDGGAPGSGASWSSGVTGSYYRTVMDDRLQANIAAGLYHVDAGPFDSTVASILLGLRYGF